jgi:hypothetical protein
VADLERPLWTPLVGAFGARELADPPALGAGHTEFDSRAPDEWACSAAGSAPPRQGGGPGFESPQVHAREGHARQAQKEERPVEAREVLRSIRRMGTRF